MRLKQPCTPNCEKRSGVCHSVCDEWKLYEVERNKWYEERRNRIEAENNSYILKPYKGKKK